MKCPSCGSENKNTNIKCEICGAVLHPEEEEKYEAAKNVESPFYGNNSEIDGISKTLNSRKVNSKNIGCFSNVILTIIMIPWIFAGLVFIGVSIYSLINNTRRASDFVEAEGTIVDFVLQRSGRGDKRYNAIYEFEVDGTKYTASPDKEGTKNSFKKTAKIMYNPENPNENLMSAGWGSLLVTGIIMEIVIIAIFIFIKRKIRDLTEDINNNREE
ncbi:MAG: DUF3592 domain-containing protein [Lachnospiraceae bacterium]|nr:DUF3592 domain-containing protein [Lachnospiraceae bacterium]